MSKILLLGSLLVAMVLSGIAPVSRSVWYVESVWSVGVLLLLVIMRNRWRFSTAAYTCLWVWMILQTIGAHYSFEQVPMAWLMEPLGLTRNPYDRFAHYAVGWFAFPFAELFDRKGWVCSVGCAAFFAVMTTVAMAGLWEIVEWVYAAVDGGETGAAFLGSQGDIWDAQKDILCDTCGAISAALLYYCLRRRAKSNLV